MKKGSRNLLIFVLIIVGVFGLAFSDNLPFDVSSQQVVTSVTSLTSVSNVADLNKLVFRISAVTGIGSEEIVGSATDSQFNNALAQAGSNAWKTDFDLSFKSAVTKEEAIYPITQQGGVLSEYYVQRKIDPGLFYSPPPCTKATNEQIIYDHDFDAGDRFCIIKKDIGSLGVLSSANIKVDVGFELKNGQETLNGSITNIEGDRSAEIRNSAGELVGRVQLSGVSKSAGANPPTESLYGAVYVNGKGWHLNTKDNIRAYQNQRDTLSSNINLFSSSTQFQLEKSPFEVCTTYGITITDAERNDCIEKKLGELINPVLSRALLLDFPTIFADGSMFFENALSTTSGKIRYVPNTPVLTTTNIVIDLQAKWIGVRNLVSRPIITSITCADFSQNGVIKVDVKNSGEVTSTFGAVLNSCGSFNQLTTVGEQSISAGSTKQFLIPIDSKGLSKTESCSVSAFNSELPQTLRDTKPISCTSQVISTCQVGDQTLTKNSQGIDCVNECSDGSYSSTPSFCCESGVTPKVVNGKLQYECSKADDGSTGECAWYDVVCKFKSSLSSLGKALGIFLNIIAIIGGIVSIVVFKDLLGRIKALRENKPVLISISLLFGIGSTILLLSFVGSIWFYVTLGLYLVYAFVIPKLFPAVRFFK